MSSAPEHRRESDGGTRPPPPPDLSGRTLGDFRLLRRLGLGGMGQVYLAEQSSLRRKVALKILRPELAANSDSLRRFQNEAEAVARATHANIVQVYATGEADGHPYMALEYVEGRNLRDYVARRGPPPLPLALSIMRQVAAALQRAGELGIIHRDVKPENILLTRHGEVKVADFGLSRVLSGDGPPVNLTQSGMTMGTPLYMSPEQVEGKPLDPRTDIYSFGGTCYYMLAGQPPFRGTTAFEVAVKHVRDEPLPLQQLRPDLPAALCELVHAMMAKDPSRRPQTGRDVIEALARLQQAGPGQPAATPILAPGPLAASPVRRPWPRFLARLLGTVFLAAAAGALLAWARTWTAETVTAPAAVLRERPRLADEREQFLLRAVAEYTRPTATDSQLQLGLSHCQELAVLYLEQWRLEEAEALFKDLAARPPNQRALRALGRLGQAMILAFRNQAEESNRLFLELLKDKQLEADRFDRRGPATLPQLRYQLARALEYNAANATVEAPFPPALERFRRPPRLGNPSRSTSEKERDSKPH